MIPDVYRYMVPSVLVSLCAAVDGYVARKLNQTSAFGAWVHVLYFTSYR